MKKVKSKRSQWLSALSSIPVDTLVSLNKELSGNWQVRPKSMPVAGLGLLRLNDSAMNEPFYLGEIPVASAWLEVSTPQGQKAEGAAQIMDDRIEFAEALALCDAVLSAQLPGWEQVEALVEQGLMHRAAIARERKQLLAHTQVEFSLLDDVGNDNVNA